MNKYISNVLTATLLAALLSAVFGPFAALAQDVSGQGASTAGTARFCERLANLNTQLGQRLSEREQMLQTRRQERSGNLAELRAQQVDRLAANRESWDQRREERYTKLAEHAQTDAQKQAVVDFKAALEAAVIARRDAVNDALVIFKTAADQAALNRKAGIDAAIIAFKTARDAAFAVAREDCANNVQAATVRTTLTAALKVAQDQFKTALQAVERARDALQGAAETRKLAIEQAIQTFRAALEQAKAALKAAFAQE